MSYPTPLETLLVATDFSSAAERATEHAVELARHHDAKILLVHAAAGFETPPAPDAAAEKPPQAPRLAGAPQLAAAAEKLRALGLEVREVCRLGAPARLILEEAERSGCGLIVLGTQGRSGWRRFFLGSTTRRVIEHATCPVLAVHQADPVRPAGQRVVVLATDFSEASRRAILRAAQIVPLAPADTAVLCHAAYLSPTVVPAVAPFSVPELEQLIYEGTKERLAEEGRFLHLAGVACRTELLEGYPADTVAAQAETLGAALIVAGSVGRTGLAHLLIGSTAERLASIAHCPVLVVPPEQAPSWRSEAAID